MVRGGQPDVGSTTALSRVTPRPGADGRTPQDSQPPPRRQGDFERSVRTLRVRRLQTFVSTAEANTSGDTPPPNVENAAGLRSKPLHLPAQVARRRIRPFRRRVPQAEARSHLKRGPRPLIRAGLLSRLLSKGLHDCLKRSQDIETEFTISSNVQQASALVRKGGLEPPRP